MSGAQAARRGAQPGAAAAGGAARASWCTGPPAAPGRCPFKQLHGVVLHASVSCGARPPGLGHWILSDLQAPPLREEGLPGGAGRLEGKLLPQWLGLKWQDRQMGVGGGRGRQKWMREAHQSREQAAPDGDQLESWLTSGSRAGGGKGPERRIEHQRSGAQVGQLGANAHPH